MLISSLLVLNLMLICISGNSTDLTDSHVIDAVVAYGKANVSFPVVDFYLSQNETADTAVTSSGRVNVYETARNYCMFGGERVTFVRPTESTTEIIFESEHKSDEGASLKLSKQLQPSNQSLVDYILHLSEGTSVKYVNVYENARYAVESKQHNNTDGDGNTNRSKRSLTTEGTQKSHSHSNHDTTTESILGKIRENFVKGFFDAANFFPNPEEKRKVAEEFFRSKPNEKSNTTDGKEGLMEKILRFFQKDYKKREKREIIRLDDTLRSGDENYKTNTYNLVFISPQVMLTESSFYSTWLKYMENKKKDIESSVLNCNKELTHVVCRNEDSVNLINSLTTGIVQTNGTLSVDITCHDTIENTNKSVKKTYETVLQKRITLEDDIYPKPITTKLRSSEKYFNATEFQNSMKNISTKYATKFMKLKDFIAEVSTRAGQQWWEAVQERNERSSEERRINEKIPSGQKNLWQFFRKSLQSTAKISLTPEKADQERSEEMPFKDKLRFNTCTTENNRNYQSTSDFCPVTSMRKSEKCKSSNKCHSRELFRNVLLNSKLQRTCQSCNSAATGTLYEKANILDHNSILWNYFRKSLVNITTNKNDSAKTLSSNRKTYYRTQSAVFTYRKKTTTTQLYNANKKRNDDDALFITDDSKWHVNGTFDYEEFCRFIRSTAIPELAAFFTDTFTTTTERVTTKKSIFDIIRNVFRRKVETTPKILERNRTESEEDFRYYKYLIDKKDKNLNITQEDLQKIKIGNITFS